MSEPTVRLFESTRDLPVWKVCYNAVIETEVGAVITYAQIQHDATCDRGTACAGMIKANEELQREGLNRTRNKRSTGWVVITPAEAIELAQRQRRKTERAGDRGVGIIAGVQRRRGELSPEQRADIDHETRIALRRMDIDGRRRRNSRSLSEISKTLELGS